VCGIFRTHGGNEKFSSENSEGREISVTWKVNTELNHRKIRREATEWIQEAQERVQRTLVNKM
jgi:hypothetical protein